MTFGAPALQIDFSPDIYFQNFAEGSANIRGPQSLSFRKHARPIDW
jgi:hypothetical protein